MNRAEVEALKEENSRLSKELKQRSFELSVLYEITGSISYTLNYDDFLRIIVQSIHKLINYDICTSLIIQPGEKASRMVIYAAYPLSRGMVENVKKKVTAALNSLRDEQILEEDVSLDIKGEVMDNVSGLEPRMRSSFDVPFFVHDKAVGILNVSSAKDISYSDEEIKLLYAIASQASAAAERLQAVLAAEKNKMKMMVERMSEGVVMLDEKDKLVVLNSAARDFLGYRDEELDARRFLGLLNGLNLLNSYDEIKNSGGRWEKELCLNNPQCPRIIRLEADLINDADRFLGLVMVLRDITKEKELDKMKDDFVSLVSHELRTPLAGIKGATENLLDEIPGGLNPSQKDCLALTRRNIERLERLISDLLDISRMEAGKIKLDKKPVDINAVISEVLRLLESPAGNSGLKFLTSFAGSLPLVEADPDRMIQVVTNLVGNAVKFTPAGGRITVSTFQEENNVRVDVVDTGIGISREDAERVFDKFYQIHSPDVKQKKGTGLGLTICKGIVEEHGGKIWVEPASGEGSRFSFTLPISHNTL